MELKPAGRCRAVDALTQTDERDAHDVQFVQERHQVAEVPPEPVQAPADQDIELTAFGVQDERIEGRPAILGPGHPFVDVLDCRPAPGRDVLAQFGELVLGLLVERRDPSVDRSPYSFRFLVPLND